MVAPSLKGSRKRQRQEGLLNWQSTSSLQSPVGRLLSYRLCRKGNVSAALKSRVGFSDVKVWVETLSWVCGPGRTVLYSDVFIVSPSICSAGQSTKVPKRADTFHSWGFSPSKEGREDHNGEGEEPETCPSLSRLTSRLSLMCILCYNRVKTLSLP